MSRVTKMLFVIALSAITFNALAEYRELSDKEWVATIYDGHIVSTALFSFIPKDNPDGWTDIGVEFDKFREGGECTGFFYIYTYKPKAHKKLRNLNEKQISMLEDEFKNSMVIIDGVKLPPVGNAWVEVVTSGKAVEMTVRVGLTHEILKAMMQGELITFSLTTDNVIKFTLSGAKATINYALEICE